MREHLKSYVDFSEEELDVIEDYFERVSYAKRDHILSAGDIEHFQHFIVKGSVRGYIVDYQGKEHNIVFGFENHWFSDMESFVNGSPASYSFQALEPLEVLVISKPDWEFLIDRFPHFAEYSSTLFRNAMVFQQRRIAEHFMQTAEERYACVINTYPDILQRISLKNIASYLGVTPEFISILRKKSVGK